MNNSKISRLAATTVVSASLVSGALAAYPFLEIEPNNTRTTANLSGGGMLAGDTITGNTTGISTTVAGAASADYFRLGTAGAALGIYKYRLNITTTTTSTHTLSIRGLTQVGSTVTGGTINTASSVDATIQSSAAAQRYVQWYGFGKSEEMTVRVTGTTTTTADYNLTLKRSDVTDVRFLGNFEPGQITLTTVGQTGASQTDTDMWVYDSNFNAIATFGNDDATVLGGATASSLGSFLRRTFTKGDYYIAISRFGFQNNQPSAFDDGFSGAVLEFPDAATCSSSLTTGSMGLRITDSLGATALGDHVTDEAFEVNFYKFTVVPEPATMTALALGLGALAARRRRK